MRKPGRILVALIGLAACAGREETDRSVEQGLWNGVDCTLTQGYWKNHRDAWPTTSLALGTVTYSQAQLLAIFHQPVNGNGLIALSHQLIAARLNVAKSASAAGISTALASADALIADQLVPPIGSGWLEATELTTTLDEYNNGALGPGHCGDPAPARCEGCGTTGVVP